MKKNYIQPAVQEALIAGMFLMQSVSPGGGGTDGSGKVNDAFTNEQW